MTGDVTLGFLRRMLANVGFPAFTFNGSTSGTTKLQASAVASGTLTLPAATDTLVGKATTDTFTNKTIQGGTINGANTISGNIQSDIKKSSAQTDTITTALANITGLTGQALVAGATYKFRCVLPGTADGTSGISVGFKYTTATLTSIEATGITYTASAMAAVHTTSTTDQALIIDKAAVVLLSVIEGTMVVNAAGTVALQVATHTGTTTASIYVGATMEFVRIA